MNKLRNLMSGILMLLALAALPVTALAASSNASDPDLVGLWHMDGDWSDSSGNGNNGTPYNGVTFSSDGKAGTRSGAFDGVNDFVDIGDPSNGSLDFGTNDFAISAWIKTSANGVRQDILDKRGTDSKGYLLGVGDDNKVHLYLSQGSASAETISNSTVNDGKWHQVVGVFSRSGNALLYVDGLQDGAPAGISGVGDINNGGKAIIGYHNPAITSLWKFFNGLIDEVAIYKRALSATEIQEQYRTYVVNSPTVNPVTSPTTASTITLSGTKPANSAIVVNGKTLVPLDATTTWQTTYSLSPGTNNLTVTAQDELNHNSLPVTLTVVLDAAPPQVATTTPANNVILQVAPGAVTFTLADALSPLDYTATLTGAAVTKASGLSVSGTWSSSGNGTTGTVKFTPTAALSDGAYTFVIKPTDILANSMTYTLTFTIDSIPPAAPGIDPVTASINTTSKTFTGTKSSDSAAVAVGCAGATVGAISYPTATTWSVNVFGLKEGGNTITAFAVDAAGNRSEVASATISVDTTPPVVGATPASGIYNSSQSVALAANESAVIYYTTDGSTPTASAAIFSHPITIAANATLKYFAKDLAGNDSEIKTENYVIDTTPPVLTVSTLSDGAYTNCEMLNIAGTVTDNSEVKGITVNDTAVQVNADGSFSYALLLQKGINDITVTATDSVGNMVADTRRVTLDQTAPILAVTAPADNSRTGKPLLQLTGTVDKSSAVTVKVKDMVQSALMDGGAFTATVNVEPGWNTAEIFATDLAGNQSSAKRTVVFDDQVPSLAVTVPNQDIRTNQSSLTIKGTVHDALTAVSVAITKDNEIFTPQVIDGTFEQVVNLSEEKTYAIVVTATNEVGTSTSVQRNVVYDITPPTFSVDPVTSPTTQSSLSVTGTREAGTAVTVTCPTATVGEVSYPTPITWQANISGLTKGGNVITAASADAAGNAVTATATVVLATKPPQITITASRDVVWPPDNKMVPVTIAGGVEANGSDIKSVSIFVTDEYGKYDYKDLTFGSTVMLEAWRKGNDTDGRKYTITVVVTDKGGNAAAKTATVTVPHDYPYRK